MITNTTHASVPAAKYFDRSPDTNELLWFAAPPLNVVRAPAAPKHSMAYLHYLARKRKEMDMLGSRSNGDEGDAADVGVDVNMDSGAQGGGGGGGGHGPAAGKRQRSAVRPTVSEMMSAALDAVAGQLG